MTLLSQAVVLYRDTSGVPVALEDACPHRKLPLSMGRLKGDDVGARDTAVKDITANGDHQPFDPALVAADGQRVEQLTAEQEQLQQQLQEKELEAQGIYVIGVNVRLLSEMDNIVLASSIGESVVVTVV